MLVRGAAVALPLLEQLDGGSEALTGGPLQQLAGPFLVTRAPDAAQQQLTQDELGRRVPELGRSLVEVDARLKVRMNLLGKALAHFCETGKKLELGGPTG